MYSLFVNSKLLWMSAIKEGDKWRNHDTTPESISWPLWHILFLHNCYGASAEQILRPGFLCFLFFSLHVTCQGFFYWVTCLWSSTKKAFSLSCSGLGSVPCEAAVFWRLLGLVFCAESLATSLLAGNQDWPFVLKNFSVLLLLKPHSSFCPG